jgi:hypothetical protein
MFEERKNLLTTLAKDQSGAQSRFSDEVGINIPGTY